MWELEKVKSNFNDIEEVQKGIEYKGSINTIGKFFDMVVSE